VLPANNRPLAQCKTAPEGAFWYFVCSARATPLSCVSSFLRDRSS